MRLVDELTRFITIDTLAEIRRRLLEEIITKRANERMFDWQQQIIFHSNGKIISFSPLHILFSATDSNSIMIIRALLEDMIKNGEKRELQNLLMNTKDSQGRVCFDYDIDFRLIPITESHAAAKIHSNGKFGRKGENQIPEVNFEKQMRRKRSG